MLTGDSRADRDRDRVRASASTSSARSCCRRTRWRRSKSCSAATDRWRWSATASTTRRRSRSADVGIAMGAAGSDAALETADVALMADELLKIPYAFRLSRATVRNIRVNLAISVVMKAAFVVAGGGRRRDARGWRSSPTPARRSSSSRTRCRLAAGGLIARRALDARSDMVSMRFVPPCDSPVILGRCVLPLVRAVCGAGFDSHTFATRIPSTASTRILRPSTSIVSPTRGAASEPSQHVSADGRCRCPRRCAGRTAR